MGNVFSFHYLMVTFDEKHFFFLVLGNAFCGTPGKSWGWWCEKWTTTYSQIDSSYDQSIIAKIVLNNKMNTQQEVIQISMWICECYICSKGRVPKKTDYLVTLIKRVGRYLAEITISWSFEIVTCYWGRWVFEEDVTI